MACEATAPRADLAAAGQEVIVLGVEARTRRQQMSAYSTARPAGQTAQWVIVIESVVIAARAFALVATLLTDLTDCVAWAFQPCVVGGASAKLLTRGRLLCDRRTLRQASEPGARNLLDAPLRNLAQSKVAGTNTRRSENSVGWSLRNSGWGTLR